MESKKLKKREKQIKRQVGNNKARTQKSFKGINREC
jgi:hypothetical protein